MRRETQRDCVDEIRKNSSLSGGELTYERVRSVGMRSRILFTACPLDMPQKAGVCGSCTVASVQVVTWGVPHRLQTSVKRPCKGHLTCATRRTRLRHSPPPSRVPRALTSANPWSPSNTPLKLSRRRCLQSPRRCNQLRTIAEHLCPLLHLLQLLPMTTRVSALCYER